MLSPEHLRTLPDEILELFEQVQMWVIMDISKHYKLTATSKYQLMTLFENAYNEKLEAFKPLLIETIKQMVDKSYKMGYTVNEQLAISAVKLITDDLLNITQSLGFKLPNGEYQEVSKIYQSQLNQATLKAVSGVSTYSEAIRTAIKIMSKTGMSYVDYATGHADSVIVATRRAVFGGIKNMAREQAKANAAFMGTDVFEISFHMGYRPTHNWGGRRYSLSGSYGYPTREQLFVDGSPDDYGCLHDEYPVMHDSPRAYNARSLAKLIKESESKKEFNGKEYDSWQANKKQREYERVMRRARLEMAGLKEFDKKSYKLISLKYKLIRREYLAFSKAMNIQPQLERVGV